ncbi:hypothetical protein DFAR_3610022 [Desulfarculales bacterium]
MVLDTWLSLERVPGAPVFRVGDGCHAVWLERRAAYEGLLKRWSFAFNPLHRAFLDLERRTLQALELKQVVANSHLVSGELAKHYGLGPDRVQVVYNAVDEDRLAPALDPQTRLRKRRELDLPQGLPVLLFLGSGFERKGLAFALEALARLPKVILMVAGRDRVTAYKTLARRLGYWGGCASWGRPARWPASWPPPTPCCCPLSTILALTLAWALFAGLPVVTTLANGAAELVMDGLNGCLVPEPADTVALATACQLAWTLPRPVPHHLPSQRQWLDSTLAILEGASRAEPALSGRARDAAHGKLMLGWRPDGENCGWLAGNVREALELHGPAGDTGCLHHGHRRHGAVHPGPDGLGALLRRGRAGASAPPTSAYGQHFSAPSLPLPQQPLQPCLADRQIVEELLPKHGGAPRQR